jgi:hypothetical protein
MAVGDIDALAPDPEADARRARLSDSLSVEAQLPFMAVRYHHKGGSPRRTMLAHSAHAVTRSA